MRRRKLELGEEEYKEISRLVKRARQDGEVWIEARLKAVLLNSRGQSSAQVAQKLGFSRSKVSAWLDNFEKLGVQGILDNRRSGRPPGLTARKREKLMRIYDRHPQDYATRKAERLIPWGHLCHWRPFWTFPMLAVVIEVEFGIRYTPGGVRNLMFGCEVAKHGRWYRREPIQGNRGVSAPAERVDHPVPGDP